jgi:hypothetical protein
MMHVSVFGMRFGGSILVLSVALSIALGLFLVPAHCAPAVFWSSGPVGPNETALVVGHELIDVTEIRIERSRDTSDSSGHSPIAARRIPVERKPTGTVYFAVPADFDMGVYRYEIVTPTGSASGLLNNPMLHWAQGNLGHAASPGGELRVFGRCITLTSGALLKFERQGSDERTVIPMRNGSLWTASALVPTTMQPGSYNISVWNGRGGVEAWSNSVKIEIRNPEIVSGRIVSAMEYGGRGDGLSDDTAAIDSGLADIAKTGGTLFLPRGRYLLKRPIVVPKGVTLRGADKDLTSLFWPDFETPPDSLISGEQDFSIEDLSLYASNHHHVISGGFSNRDGSAGNIRIRRVRIRASAFRGHISESEISRRLSTMKTGVGGPNGADAIRLRGANLEISGCDILASGSSLFILDSEDVVISDNVFRNGRGGWYSISGSRRVLVERNGFVGMDLGASGGGINSLFSREGSSENIWLFKNKFRMMYAWDREAMTTDGPGGTYFGLVDKFNDRKLFLAGPLTPGSRSLVGQGVFILDGRGAGQFAQIEASDGETLVLDRQWEVSPDQTSLVTITAMVQHYLIVENEFSDAGTAVQLYGTSVEQIVAGNSSARTAGFINQGRWYEHFQPSWYIQYLNNRIVDGTVYRGGPDGSIFSGDAVIGAYGLPDPRIRSPLVLGIVMRGNSLAENARIEVGRCGGIAPTIRGIVIERNVVLNNVDPISGVGPGCDALVRDNAIGKQ